MRTSKFSPEQIAQALRVSSAAGGAYYETAWYAQALMQLGDAYDARGDRRKATEYYTKYVELLKDADPPISTQVRAVREKLVQLGGEPGVKPKTVGKP